MTTPSMILVNLALGGGWPIEDTPNHSVMKVDYIHAYARRATRDTGSCAPQTGSSGHGRG
jgi:hypothetical protein